MRLTGRDLLNRKVFAAGIDVGKLKDLYFDDESWELRYAVVDTGSWLERHEVLLAPQCFHPPTPGGDQLRTDLTPKQVEDSPPVTSDMPVSRQYEHRLHEYYGWTPYWMAPLYPAPLSEPKLGRLGPPDELTAMREAMIEKGDPHLRGFKEIKGYRIEGTDGVLGHFDDMLLDDQTWRIEQLVIDTRQWLPRKQVTIGVNAVTGISWSEGRIRVRYNVQAIKNGPEVHV